MFKDAKLWKDAFEKAKKIVESECKAYSGKPDSDDSESEISCSDSENETSIKIQDEEASPASSTVEGKTHSKEQKSIDSEVTKSTEDVTTNLENLSVKEQE